MIKVITNSNEEKSRKLSDEGMRKKRTEEGPTKKRANLVCKLHWWKQHCVKIEGVKGKKKRLKTSLTKNICGCSSCVFPFMGISSVGFSFGGLYLGYS
jgi:hypothetical protein